MAKQLLSVTKSLKDYKGTALNSGIVAGTAAIQQLTTLAAYSCPCVSLAQLGPNCSSVKEGSQCTVLLNYGYGLSFIIAPAVALFVAGMAGNPRFWKTVTGYLGKTERYHRECDDICATLLSIAGKALVSPIAWIAMAMLDGKYLACTITPLPYDVEHPSAKYLDCEAVASSSKIFYSNAFKSNRSFSQFIGWALIALMAVTGIIIYSIIMCTSPLTYYNAKYYSLYRSHEEAEFEDEMNRKAQKDAEANVLKFMEIRRSKELWDRISTVYEFHRDKKHLALYSNLHAWIIECENQQIHESSSSSRYEKL